MSDLKSYVERIERIREEKRGLTEDERDIFTEVKSSGYDGKALRRVLQRRAMGDAAVAELDAIVDAYEAALGAKSVAAEELRRGASVRQAARKAGIGDGTAQRAKKLISGTHPSIGGSTPPQPAGNDAPRSSSAAASPPVETETDRAVTTSSAPEGPGGEEPPRPDPDDRAIRPATPTEVEAIQAAIDRHNAGKTTAAPDAPLVLPAFLKRGTPEHEAAVKGART